MPVLYLLVNHKMPYAFCGESFSTGNDHVLASLSGVGVRMAAPGLVFMGSTAVFSFVQT